MTAAPGSMRLLFVVQRYGTDVAGGAEQACRSYAARLAARGHRVEVLTSCAVSYVDWANHYEPGSSELDGVTVHRLPVRAPRDGGSFSLFNQRVVYGHRPVPLYQQREWMRQQGPYIPELAPWLVARAGAYDRVIFFTYLYYTTYAGLPAATGRALTVLQPLAHDELPLELPLFRSVFSLPTGFAFLTPEERALVRSRFATAGKPEVVTGIGVEMGEEARGGFRGEHGIGRRPYIVYVGRVDPAKGSEELFEYFTMYKRSHPGPLALVIVGERIKELPSHPDVIVTGFVPGSERAAALSGALLLVQPSHFESFSIVLAEAWARGIPALVQGRCAVLAGQAARSRGAIAYRGWAEFEVALERLVRDQALRRSLGAAGRSYVEANYSWQAVIGRYERFLWSLGAGRLTS